MYSCLYKTGEPLPRVRVLPKETHPAPVTQLWAVGRARTVPAAPDLADANSAEDLRFCATFVKEVFAAVRTRVVEDRSASPRPFSGHTKGGDRVVCVATRCRFQARSALTISFQGTIAKFLSHSKAAWKTKSLQREERLLISHLTSCLVQ